MVWFAVQCERMFSLQEATSRGPDRSSPCAASRAPSALHTHTCTPNTSRPPCGVPAVWVMRVGLQVLEGARPLKPGRLDLESQFKKMISV